MNYVANSFSINMIGNAVTLKFVPVGRNIAEAFVSNPFTSIIGHQDTANIVSKMLNTNIPFNRATVTVDWKQDVLLVCQYTGTRLPEGATELPVGSRIDFWMVSL